MKKSEFIAVRTTEETKITLEKIAKEEDRSISYIANRIIENFLKNKESSSQ